nr:immunoglobulin heavy chain junction region [Macaca mulatta]
CATGYSGTWTNWYFDFW